MKIKIFGHTIDVSILKEHQSQHAATAELRREFGEHPIKGLTPQKMASLLLTAETGDLALQAALGEELEERIAHLFAELSKRKRAPMSLPFRIAPPKNHPTSWEVGYAEELTQRMEMIEVQSWRERDVDETLDTPSIADVIFDMMDGLMHGYSCIETAWDNEGLDWTPRLYHRHPSWFMTPQLNRNKLMLRSNQSQVVHGPNQLTETVNAQALRPWGWITHTHRGKSGYLTRAGLVRVVAWPSLWLLYSATDFAELLHILGIPPITGKYPNNATTSEKSSLMSALMTLGHKARGIMPENMEVEFHQHADLKGDHFMNMIGWAEKSISKAVVGGTLTTDADGGTATNALGNVHEGQFGALRKSDITQICGTLTRDFAVPMSILNAQKGKVSETRPFRFTIDTNEHEDLGKFGEALSKFQHTGFLNAIPVSWVRERTGVPEPAKDEQTLGDLMPAPAAPTPLGAHHNHAALKKEQPYERESLENLADDMAEDWRPIMEPMLEPLFKALENVKTLEDVDNILAETAGQMNLEPYAKKMFNALMMANIYGRATPPEEK